MARILVVDDQELMRDSLAANLVRERHDVVATGDGAHAVTHLEGPSRFDLLITDLKMPKMTGIELLAEAKQFKLVVHDAGPGIPAGVMDKIFNPFFTTKDNGTGLGLAIVHRVVEAHDGTILVTNPDGGGARFEIRV